MKKLLVTLALVLVAYSAPLAAASVAVDVPDYVDVFDVTLGLGALGALTLEGINTVRQRCQAESRSPGTANALRALFKTLNDVYRNVDLKFKAISGLDSADVVISDAACKLFALFGKKPSASTTDAWFKVSDHASAAAAAGDVVVKYLGTGGGSQEQCVTFPNGLKLGTGATAGCHTANNGNTKSNVADAVTGFAIVGAA